MCKCRHMHVEESYPKIPVKSEKELDAALNSAKEQKTVEQEIGLSFGEVILQASEQGVDFTELELGESLTFTARSSQRVTVKQGGEWYYYADYGLGTYLTSPFAVTFGNVTATAYCIEPSKSGAGSGTYQITRLEGNKKLAKVCYYGSEVAGTSGFFAKYHTDFSAGKRFIITHLAASYANGNSDAFYGTNSTSESLALSGAGFSAYLESSLKKKADGSYDFDSAIPVVIGENGATEMFTDKKGYACNIPLPYGTYIVRETMTPHNYKPVDDFVVRITENHPNTPQKWRVLLDKEFEAKLKIVKVDEETKKPVLQKGTEFEIYDLKRKKYVEQVTTYPTTVVHKSYFTDEQGYLILPQNLKMGKYRIEEVHAPNGYTLNENYYEMTVDSNTAYQMDGTSGDVIIEVVYENRPVKGKLTIVKDGEILEGFQDDFTYQKENLKGAQFEIYAAEDIYTPDFQKDENGNRVLEYAKAIEYNFAEFHSVIKPKARDSFYQDMNENSFIKIANRYLYPTFKLKVKKILNIIKNIDVKHRRNK